MIPDVFSDKNLQQIAELFIMKISLCTILF